jgi:hypothetical protein
LCICFVLPYGNKYIIYLLINVNIKYWHKIPVFYFIFVLRFF